MTIRTKLLLGFAAMIGVMCGLGGLAYYVCVTGSRSAVQLSEMTRDVLICSDLIEDLSMCRMRVKDYLITNREADVEKYDQYRARIESTLQACEENFQNPERRAWIADLRAGFAEYDTTFEKVKLIIAERNRLITDQCDRLGSEINTLLDSTAKDSADDESQQIRQLALESIGDLSQFRLSVWKYIKTRKPAHYLRANSRSRRCRTNWQTRPRQPWERFTKMVSSSVNACWTITESHLKKSTN